MADTDEEVDMDDEIAQLDEFDVELDELEEELNHDDMDELSHYASPYYDPVKAHEYYERTKKLKGRKSTSGLNESGKKAASYVKQQLDAERKQKVETHKNDTNKSVTSNSEKTKEDIKAHNATMKKSIASLRAKLKNMSAMDKAMYRDQIESKIDNLRAQNDAKKRANPREEDI